MQAVCRDQGLKWNADLEWNPPLLSASQCDDVPRTLCATTPACLALGCWRAATAAHVPPSRPPAPAPTLQLPPPAVEKHMKHDGSKPALFAPNGSEANVEMASVGP